MEDFKPTDLNTKAYRSAIVQKGGAIEMDRYIYNMEGEGLGNLFGSLLRKAIPLIGTTIKGVAKAAKPIVVAAGKDLVTAGAKRGVEELSKKIYSPGKNTVVHRPHKKRRRAKKWQSL